MGGLDVTIASQVIGVKRGYGLVHRYGFKPVVEKSEIKKNLAKQN